MEGPSRFRWIEVLHSEIGLRDVFTRDGQLSCPLDISEVVLEVRRPSAVLEGVGRFAALLEGECAPCPEISRESGSGPNSQFCTAHLSDIFLFVENHLLNL